MFASELKALRPLAAAAGMALRVRPQGIYDYLSLCVVPQPETIYENVHVLPPGSWLLAHRFTRRPSSVRSGSNERGAGKGPGA